MEDLELDDAELLASLEAQEEVEMVLSDPAQDSGYGTISATSTHSSRRSPVRSLVSTALSRWVGKNMPLLYIKMLELLSFHCRANMHVTFIFQHL